jgi:hypothetical protein
MAIRDEARDPWTYLLGGLAGGVAWAVGLPVLAAVGVGAAVLGVKAVVGSALGGGPGDAGPELLPVTGHSPEEGWLRRGERAVASFAKLASSVPKGMISERSRTIGEQARKTLDGLRRLAGQASTTREVGRHIDAASLANEKQRLQTQLAAATDPDIEAELTKSLDSVTEQIQIADRLSQSLQTLIARMESGALGLERLVAQLAELLALSESSTSPVEGAQQLEALADELEGLRSGLAETEQLSRRALSAYGGDDVASDGNEPRPDR